MSGVKKLRVREAKARDVGLFRKLWADFLRDQVEQGAKVADNARSLKFFEKLFEIYVMGAYEGTALLVADKGILMWGDAGSPIEYTAGKTAIAWGSYVAPVENRVEIYAALETRALEVLREKNFKGVTRSVFQAEVDDLDDAWEPVSLGVYRTLEES
jgi:hypothetical protein